MNIHEYQAKALFRLFKIPVLEGYLAHTATEAEAAAQKLKTERTVVKAQIHAGGRGKGGGVKLANSPKEAGKIANDMLGMHLVTHQTLADGKLVQKIYVEAGANIKDEYYLSIVLDRQKEVPVIVASTEGGVEIETVAEQTPEKIIKIHIDPLFGIQDFQIRKLSKTLCLNKTQSRHFHQFIKSLYQLYQEKDAELIEINPLAVLTDDSIIALDAKISFDNNALYRHPDILQMRDLDEEDPAETLASEYGLSYVSLNGNVGCMVNGAGLAMSTMDIIKHKGGEPANFLDVGGGASAETVAKGLEIILKNKDVKTIFINIFGGIVRCERIARGIIEATKTIDIPIPIIVRLDGTNAQEAMEILNQSGIKTLTSVSSLDEGAEKAVKFVKA